MRSLLPLLLALASLAAATTPVANKTAAVLAAVSAKEQEVLASLTVKPDITAAVATVAAHKNLTFGDAVTVASSVGELVREREDGVSGEAASTIPDLVRCDAR